MELIFRVHLLYIECYVHFFTLILHKDFVREIVLQCFTEDGLKTQEKFGDLPWSYSKEAAQDAFGAELGRPDSSVCSLSITPACHGK